MSEEIILRFDPRRHQVSGVMAAAMENQDESLIEQAIADAIMAGTILGEFAGIESEDDYIAMIRAAIPNARKAARALAQENGDA